jgi:hypothetical protein
VLKIPDGISHVLIQHLPTFYDHASAIPGHVLEGMSSEQLESLFFRPDVGMQELRKRKFLEAIEDEKEDGG